MFNNDQSGQTRFGDSQYDQSQGFQQGATSQYGQSQGSQGTTVLQPVFVEIVTLEQTTIEAAQQARPRFTENAVLETVKNIQSGATFDMNDTRVEAAPILFPGGTPLEETQQAGEPVQQQTQQFSQQQIQSEQLQTTVVSEPSQAQISEAAEAKYVAESAALQARIEQLSAERRQTREQLQGEISSRDQQVQRLQQDLEQREEQIEQLERKTESLPTSEILQAEVSHRDKKILQLDLEIERLQAELAKLSASRQQTQTFVQPTVLQQQPIAQPSGAIHRTLVGDTFTNTRLVEQHPISAGQTEHLDTETEKHHHRHGHGHLSRHERKQLEKQEGAGLGADTESTHLSRHERKQLEKQQEGQLGEDDSGRHGRHHHLHIGKHGHRSSTSPTRGQGLSGTQGLEAGQPLNAPQGVALAGTTLNQEKYGANAALPAAQTYQAK